MSIEHHILGAAGRDNALLCNIHTGEANIRLLFDCGEGTLAPLPFAEIQRIDHLCFSHLHMDHIGGFDSFFRCTYNRTNKPNVIWGPPETSRILHHRFQGFRWNLYAGQTASWTVHDIAPTAVTRTRFELYVFEVPGTRSSGTTGRVTDAARERPGERKGVATDSHDAKLGNATAAVATHLQSMIIT